MHDLQGELFVQSEPPGAYRVYPGGPVVYNPAIRNQTLMFQLVLRTLGDIKANVGL